MEAEFSVICDFNPTIKRILLFNKCRDSRAHLSHAAQLQSNGADFLARETTLVDARAR